MHRRTLPPDSVGRDSLFLRVGVALAAIPWIAIAQAQVSSPTAPVQAGALMETAGAATPISATAQTTAQVLTVGQANYSFKPLTTTGGKLPHVHEVQSGKLPAGLGLDATTGVVTGAPAATQAPASVVFRVKDADGIYATTRSTVSFAANSPPMATVRNATPFVLTVGTPVVSFSPFKSVLRGTPPLTYVVAREQPSDSPLPEGLVLDATTGAITGTPTAPVESARVRVRVQDANGVYAPETNLLSYVVNGNGSAGGGNGVGNADGENGGDDGTPSEPATSIVATAQATRQVLTVGQADYSFKPLTASGGKLPHVYEVQSGTLPAGLAFDAATGMVTGVPAATQSEASVVFRVKDADSVLANTTSTVRFAVNSQPLATLNIVTNIVLKIDTPAVIFYPFKSVLRGTPPFTYEVALEPAGSPLPDGLAIDPATGGITGTPTVPVASAPVTIRVKDANGVFAPQTKSLDYAVIDPFPFTATAVMTPQVLTVGQTGYSFSPLTATGGATPYTLEVVSGTLPSGLRIEGTAVTGSPSTPRPAEDVMFRIKDAKGVYASTVGTVSFEVKAKEAIVRLGQHTLQAYDYPYEQAGYARSVSFIAGEGGGSAGNASASAKISLSWKIVIGYNPTLFLVGPTGIRTMVGTCVKTGPYYQSESCELTADLSANPIAGPWTLQMESGGYGSVYELDWLEIRF